MSPTKFGTLLPRRGVAKTVSDQVLYLDVKLVGGRPRQREGQNHD
jgi:hypothetical protein